jgi:anthranilate phosphoribosyltransferase
MTLTIIEGLEAGRVLSRAAAEALMEELLCGRLATPEIVRLLTAMNARPAQVAELAGFATAMRRHAAKPFAANELVPDRLVDTCGTGGKTTGTFNISTAAAIVAAAAGARVAKHGNRGMSSRSGSADVLEALGVRVDIPITRHGQAIREVGIGFLFAQAAHTSMRHAVEARKQVGVRTVFNLLGPLTNPAGARFQVVGVPSIELVDVMAATLLELEAEHAFVVHGAGGLDEISLAGETLVAEIKNGTIQRFTLTPEDFGVRLSPLQAVAGSTPQENAAAIRRILTGEHGPKRDIVVINAAAALAAAGAAPDFRGGVELAAEALRSGAANEKLETLAAFTR